MKAVIALIGVVFAALCVWLTVRIITRREGWAKRMAVWLAASVVIGYPFLFGPACWIHQRQEHLDLREAIGSTIALVYRPMLAYWKCGLPGGNVVPWYAALGTLF